MSRKPFQSVLDELEEEALGSGSHPSSGELINYQAGKLAAGAETRIAEHLAFCAECAGAILDLEAMPDVALKDLRLARSATDEEDDWKQIVLQLKAPADIDPAPLVTAAAYRHSLGPPSSSSASRSSWSGIHLLAAVLALAVLGLSWQVWSLTRRLDSPRANVLVADLEPAGRGGTREGGKPKTELPAGTEMVVFLLVESELRPFASYAAELVGPYGQLFWQTRKLARNQEGGFSLAVPVSQLPAGELEIRLYGLGSGARETIGTYSTRIELAGGP